MLRAFGGRTYGLGVLLLGLGAAWRPELRAEPQPPAAASASATAAAREAAATDPTANEAITVDTANGDVLVREYLRRETERIANASLQGMASAEDWQEQRGELHRQLREMLGLDPWPDRTPLKPVVTGKIELPTFTAEKLHFQSLPGYYVTATLYLPKDLAGPAPAVLYGCGHAQVKKNGISYGNKAAYQHHGVWFAEHGFVCLVLDTLQRGEIEGVHHGTYSQNMWWWISRGYTPAGLEAWNCIRGLDYLQSRPEVDPQRLGVTGISGGGVYSWWTAALDERIAAAVPVAGITSLHNHVVDGCVEGHCDCMYMVNTYEWDFPQVAALVAPRPLLISNADADPIFPLEGVLDVHSGARRIYRLLGAGDRVGLNITYGGHQDSQELQIHAFVWMNRHLRGVEEPIDLPARSPFEPEELKVFAELPADEVNTRIQEQFVPRAEPPAPRDAAHWAELRDHWMQQLDEKCFRSWPDAAPPAVPPQQVAVSPPADSSGRAVATYRFESQPPYQLLLEFVGSPVGPAPPAKIDLHVLDQAGWDARGRIAAEPDALVVLLAPRGVGPTEWSRDEFTRTQIRRRFMILGQTDDSGRVWDVRRALQSLRSMFDDKAPSVVLHARGDAAVWALYASLFEQPVARLDLGDVPVSHMQGPVFLNVLKYLDIPQAVAMASARGSVRVFGANVEEVQQYARQAAERWTK